MAITAKDVQRLRELTGVGMMDCKKVLTEAEGDMDRAVELMREKGLAASQKKAGRIAAEGMAYAAVIDGVGVVVEVNAETDFVSQNEKFVDFVKGIAAVVSKENPADLDALLTAPYGNGHTVQEEQQEMVLVIGENIQIRRFSRHTEGVHAPYVHAGGKIGVLVDLKVSAGLEQSEQVLELGRDIAMQIAALKPAFLDKSQVDSATLDREREILTMQAKEDPKNAKKPAEIIAKMIDGRIGKYYKENCLLQQDFVKDNNVSVEGHIAATAKALGGEISLIDAVRFEKGEGIEKKEENFAEEIAKQLGK
ncbi:MAG: translation elongation factor Ts [Oscillospiraceae bacterium]|nr:translation elongation factor Ts [Oscillospiraceae bacterium]